VPFWAAFVGVVKSNRCCNRVFMSTTPRGCAEPRTLISVTRGRRGIRRAEAFPELLIMSWRSFALKGATAWFCSSASTEWAPVSRLSRSGHKGQLPHCYRNEFRNKGRCEVQQATCSTSSTTSTFKLLHRFVSSTATTTGSFCLGNEAYNFSKQFNPENNWELCS